MGKDSAIEWTDGTFNPFLGCTKVSPACDHCYAESWAKRTGNGALWQGERRLTSRNNWRQPVLWNRRAERLGVRTKVFSASLADVFDNQIPGDWRADLWALIADTPHLDWLLLTKRPQNIAKMLPGAYVEQLVGRDLPAWPWPNVWLGTTVENQEEADRRIGHLLSVPAAVHFLSCEPLLGPVDLTRVQIGVGAEGRSDVLRGWYGGSVKGRVTRVDWIICGGESGPGRRPMDLAWARGLRDQCAAAGVAFFGKQLDKVTPLPADLMIREFPR